MLKLGLLLFSFLFFSYHVVASGSKIEPGAYNTSEYLSLLKGKKVGLVVNHTSRVHDQHLVDFLLSRDIEVQRIFAPEHGFRGDASAGELIKDQTDPQTGIAIASLYGKNKKPQQGQIQDLDVLVFDIQDVGCRFYTYISTLHLVMEACAENEKMLLILDRPNPNGDYVAGPVLKESFRSFVGMHPIPIVHGMTIGELALMINGEQWLANGAQCRMEVIKCEEYTHSTHVNLDVKPSPNLPNSRSIRLYPSLCFFEATSVSVGRGTSFPFQVLGGLDSILGKFTFTPQSIPGVAINPLNKGEKCYGVDLREIKEIPTFTLKYFISFYHQFENEKDFLTRENWLNLLAGTDQLIKDIRKGLTEEEILKKWEPEIREFKGKRKKYLLYPDFE